MISGLTTISRSYESDAFTVSKIHMDREFESIRDDVTKLDSALVSTGKSDHVPEAERKITPSRRD